jgi:hypothetical protein
VRGCRRSRGRRSRRQTLVASRAAAGRRGGLARRQRLLRAHSESKNAAAQEADEDADEDADTHTTAGASERRRAYRSRLWRAHETRMQGVWYLDDALLAGLARRAGRRE